MEAEDITGHRPFGAHESTFIDIAVVCTYHS